MVVTELISGMPNIPSQEELDPFPSETSIQSENGMHNRFINNYDGPYATVLQFNRTVVERFIMLTGFGGTITLASLPHRAYLERRLEGEENPYYKVNATADGWAVQINGQKILEGIQKKPSKKISDDVRFAREFNFTRF